METLRVVVDDGVQLNVAVTGHGPDVVVLSGGPGCVHYLADEHLAPVGYRSWFPDPRGVAQSGGGPHAMGQAIADLEAIRRATGAEHWLVLGHSWGSDLAVRYALDHPTRVRGLVGVAGHGLHRDREWSEAYTAGKATEAPIEIAWVAEVHAALWASFNDWRTLADTTVPMSFIAAGSDIRPHWPLQQLAALVPDGTFTLVDNVPHDFWATHPTLWRETCTTACDRLS